MEILALRNNMCMAPYFHNFCPEILVDKIKLLYVYNVSNFFFYFLQHHPKTHIGIRQTKNILKMDLPTDFSILFCPFLINKPSSLQNVQNATEYSMEEKSLNAGHL